MIDVNFVYLFFRESSTNEKTSRSKVPKNCGKEDQSKQWDVCIQCIHSRIYSYIIPYPSFDSVFRMSAKTFMWRTPVQRNFVFPLRIEQMYHKCNAKKKFFNLHFQFFSLLLAFIVMIRSFNQLADEDTFQLTRTLILITNSLSWYILQEKLQSVGMGVWWDEMHWKGLWKWLSARTLRCNFPMDIFLGYFLDCVVFFQSCMSHAIIPSPFFSFC